MIWATKNRLKVLGREVRKLVSAYLSENAMEKDIYMKINYVKGFCGKLWISMALRLKPLKRLTLYYYAFTPR